MSTKQANTVKRMQGMRGMEISLSHFPMI